MRLFRLVVFFSFVVFIYNNMFPKYFNFIFNEFFIVSWQEKASFMDS